MILIMMVSFRRRILCFFVSENFNFFRSNFSGRITYDEVFKISVAIYALLGFHVTPTHNYKTYEEHARRVFAKLDENSVGYVTFDEFKDICLKVNN